MIRPVRVVSVPEQAGEHENGFGALQTPAGRLPLRAMSVQADIHGLVARVKLRQRFCNPLNQPLQATYIFPLPDRGAVTSFVMEAEGQRLEALLEERDRARRRYLRAVAQGRRAAMVEEERPEVFTLQVGNILPRTETVVELVLVVPLEVLEHEATFRFPLVVAPRFVPGVPLSGPSVGSGTAPDTDQVPDASRVTPPVLLPGFPNPVQLSLEVRLHPSGLFAKGWSERLACTLHSVVVEQGPPCLVRLLPGERLNRDFLLRIPLGGESLCSNLQLAFPDDGAAAVFAVTVVPPRLQQAARTSSRDVVFVLDRSGSMSGWKIVAARRALGRMIDTLQPQDRFAVLAFDHLLEFFAGENDAEQYASGSPPRLLWASDRNRYRAVEWLSRIDAQGGTQLGPALLGAAEMLRPHAADDFDREAVLVLVTDGQMAQEDLLLRMLAQCTARRPMRIFAVGIDRAVNQGLLRRLAQQGRGWCETIESEDRLDEAMQRIHRVLAEPVLRDLQLCFEGWDGQPVDVVPEPLPEVFAQRPALICGRLPVAEAAAPLRLIVQGRLPDGTLWRQELAPEAAPAEILLPLWGRMQVRLLEDRYATRAAGDGQDELARQIVRTSLESRVLSRFTAYVVVVNRSQVICYIGPGTSVIQPVELPQGWEMAALQEIPCKQRRLVSSPGTAELFPGLARRDVEQWRESRQETPPGCEATIDYRELFRTLQDFHWARKLHVRRRIWKRLHEALRELLMAIKHRLSPEQAAYLGELICRVQQQMQRLGEHRMPEEYQLADDILEFLRSPERVVRRVFWK